MSKTTPSGYQSPDLDPREGDKDVWVSRTCRVYTREVRDYEWEVVVQANVSEGEDIHEEMHRTLEEGTYKEGTLMFEDPMPFQEFVMEVHWTDEDGAENMVSFNPPKEI